MIDEIGIKKTHDNLRNKLKDYIDAQYFAENDLMMEVSNELLNEKGVIFQEPFIEISKTYKQSVEGFLNSTLPDEHKNILNELINNKLGVFSTPFFHQIRALENYFEGNDILVTTGTGSGKTECFLWPILTELILEARNNEKSWEHEGIRALVLYPMNALVSDQLGRMRSIIGRPDDAFQCLIEKNGKKRRTRFGMYTGRTPYPGLDDTHKNKELAKVIRKNYIENKSYDELLKIGRIPSKNLEKFVSNLSVGYQITDDADSELYTRCEMQAICPDILITNYSMLEYMLMRPIENSIWEKTINWLNKDENNKLTLVIDEAHMYRGASGGEVALLVRRLIDRLGIDEDKLHCILTTASVPGNRDEEINLFANDLTGKCHENKFTIIRESLEEIAEHRKIDSETAQFYSDLSLAKLQANNEAKLSELEKIAKRFGVKSVPTNDNYKQWIFDTLNEKNEIKQIKYVCSKGGTSFSDICENVFDENIEVNISNSALENLLQLGTMGKSNTGKVLLGTKVHMLFRGLQGIRACINPKCPHCHKGNGIKLGFVTNESKELCPYCNSRMFELGMDRRCGTLFIIAYYNPNIDNATTYLWSFDNSINNKLRKIKLWIIPDERSDFFKLGGKSKKAKESSFVGTVDSKTGLLFYNENHGEDEGFIRVLVPTYYDEEDKSYSFSTCPNCGKDHTHITSFVTRGNEPFANLVKEQFDSQLVKDDDIKHGGRKVLLFSDSRQKAATLARDITLISDFESGRQAIFAAQKILDSDQRSEKTLDLLYYAFLTVVFDNKLNFFYGDEKKLFQDQLKKYEEFYASRTKRYGRMKQNIGEPPVMFYQLLLKNICDSFRSMNNLCLAQVVLAEDNEAGEEINFDFLEPISVELNIAIDEIRTIYNAWIQYLLVIKMSIFPEVSDITRNSILSYSRGGFGIDEKESFPPYMQNVLKKNGITDEQIDILVGKFNGLLQILSNPERNHNRKYILGSRLQLKTAENAKWYRCERCSGTSTFTLYNHCIYCGSDDYIKEVENEHTSRYKLWTKPVLEAAEGKTIENINVEEHTAQLSHKDSKADVWGTTEKYELAFRNIDVLDENEIIDVLSCTTTMEVGIDIGSLTSVGLRNVPPMRENYQQRAGRAGRAGAAVSSIFTYTENGAHDAWYFSHPYEIISGEPRMPWIDGENRKLVSRHINLILLEGFLREYSVGLDEINTLDFFDDTKEINYLSFIDWVKANTPFDKERTNKLIPIKDISWNEIISNIKNQLLTIKRKTVEEEFKFSSANDSDSSNYRIIDVFFAEGILPNYSFPRNIVNFWIEDYNGRVKESADRSIDIALSEYAPGRSIVINKQTYISGGLYDPYTKMRKESRFSAAEPWLELEENKRIVQYCKSMNCGWFGLDYQFDKCPLCHSEIAESRVVKPWGFAAREGRNIPETRETNEMSYASEPSYSSMPTGKKMMTIGKAKAMGFENRSNQKLVVVNKGPDDMGFSLCVKCGAIEPSAVPQKTREERKRPYRIPFMKDDSMKCRHDYIDTFLGYDFYTDMLVFEIFFDLDIFDLEVDNDVWLVPALTTFAEALTLASSRELDVEFNDLKSGYRLRVSDGKLYADIYLYDSLSSGAGYANRVEKYIDSIMNKMEEILKECNCYRSCPNCLQNFGNQRVKNKLDRHLGLELLYYLRDGYMRKEVNAKDKEYYIGMINQIAAYNGFEGLVHNSGDKYYIDCKNKTYEIVIYPALRHQVKDEDKIYFSDRMCKNSIADVWEELYKLQF